MFEKVRKTRSVGPLVTGADVVVNRERNDRNSIIAVKNDSQPIRKRELFELYGRQFKWMRHKTKECGATE
jgi:hypothetical protein